MTVVAFDPLRDKTYQSTRLGRSVADFLAWKKLGGAAERTLDQYERDLARGCMMFPELGLGEFGDSEMIHVAGAYKEKERRVRVAAWRSFFKWALGTRQITVNPTDVLPEFKRQPQPIIDVFTDAEVESLLALDVVDAAPMGVLLLGGLRKAEARQLALRHCDPDTGYIAILKGKGRKDRLVPMTARLRSLLSDLILMERLERTDHIFYGVKANARSSKRVRANPIGEGTFHRWWGRCLEQAEVRYRSPHTARHTFATSWRRAGLAVDEIKILLGHSSIRTTSDLYVHTEIADVAEHMALIEAQV